MAQKLESYFISDGRFRVYAINAIGRRKGRIVEVEVVDTGERLHGSAGRMERLVRRLRTMERLVGRLYATDPDLGFARSGKPDNRS